MLYVVIILLAFWAAYLLCRLVLLEKTLEHTAKELHEISQELEENRTLHLKTPDKHMEKLLREINENLESIRRTKRSYEKQEKEFQKEIENISHDLRTPLTAIIGYLEMMQQEELSPENQKNLEIVSNRAKSMQELIGRFYELSQVSGAEYQLELQEMDVCKSLREMTLMQYGILEKKNLEVDIELPEKPVIIKGNQEAFERIFNNLFQNVQRYAVSELQLKLQMVPESDRVCITFRNDIAQENRLANPELIFERFYMADKSRRNGGSGLGLTIAAELVAHMGGNIHAKNVEENHRSYLQIEMDFPYNV
ncbi:MAG: HAMP domain-containing histidine kinase [Lachnospiraceae bacterium]|nr:HAMP domain-containing histidine kinase [Lachnospiraceae bacterium]